MKKLFLSIAVILSYIIIITGTLTLVNLPNNLLLILGMVIIVITSFIAAKAMNYIQKNFKQTINY